MIDLETLVDELGQVNISALTLSQAKGFYVRIFGKAFDESCDSCFPSAILELKRWYAAQTKQYQSENKWRFKNEHKGKQVILGGSDSRIIIDEYSLTNSNAERILANPKMAGLLELNPNFQPDKKKVSSTNIIEELPTLEQPTISTLTEQPSEEAPLKKKRGRPASK